MRNQYRILSSIDQSLSACLLVQDPPLLGANTPLTHLQVTKGTDAALAQLKQEKLD